VIFFFLSRKKVQLASFFFEKRKRSCHVGALRLTIRGLEADIAERGRLLDDARRQAASLIDDLRGQAVDHRRAFQELEGALRERHRVESAAIAAAHERKVLELTTDFDRMRQTLLAHASQLEQKIQDTERQYETRDSRPEDLQRISQLIGQMLDKEATVQKLQGELKFYKLELENREEMYNHRFRRQTNVVPMGVPTTAAAAGIGALSATLTLPSPSSHGPLSVPPLKRLAAKSAAGSFPT
jgi:chromosome segregation ATPase